MLGLGAASRMLGIAEGTLRRWADEGQIPVYVTPGGHRRFSRAHLNGLLPAGRPRRPALARIGASPERIVRAYRRGRVRHPAPPGLPWAGRLPDADRLAFRERGRDIVEALLVHLDATDTEEGAEALRSSIEVNLLSHNHAARAASEVMLAQGRGGCLLFNISKSSFNQGSNFGPYAVAKTGLLALMRQYAVDLGRYGIRSNGINADRIRTRLFAGGVAEQRARARGVSVDEYFKDNLLRREVTAFDVAQAFGHLAQARATTGCVITVDGGNAAAFPR